MAEAPKPEEPGGKVEPPPGVKPMFIQAASLEK